MDDPLGEVLRRYHAARLLPVPADRHHELEARFRNSDFATFGTVLQYAVTHAPEAAGNRVEQTINIIQDTKKSGSTNAAVGLQKESISHMRTLRFVDGNRVLPDAYSVKTRKQYAAVGGRGPLACTLTYSVEEPGRQFALGSDCLARVKVRAVFPGAAIGVPAEWRLDLTVVFELRTEMNLTKALTATRDRLFRPGVMMTPATMLQQLGLTDEQAARAADARFEIELEYVATHTKEVTVVDVQALVARVASLIDPQFTNNGVYRDELQALAALLDRHVGRGGQVASLKTLLPKVVSLTVGDYKEMYPLRDAFVTAKADGERALLVVHADGVTRVLSSRLVECASGAASTTSLYHTVLDGELMSRDASGEAKWRFLAFDMIVAGGELTTAWPLRTRVGRLAAAVEAARGLVRCADVTIEVKRYHEIAASATGDVATETDRANIRAAVEAALADARSPVGGFPIDGLIISRPGDAVYEDTESYKYKEQRDSTIDFLARRPPATMLGRAPHADRPDAKLYWLFVGITDHMYNAMGLRRCDGYEALFGTRYTAHNPGYFPIQFSPAIAPAEAYMYWHPNSAPEIRDDVIVELRIALGETTATAEDPIGATVSDVAGGRATRYIPWEFARVRDDRDGDRRGGDYFGNDMRIAELTLLNSYNPLELDMLWMGPADSYFRGSADDRFRAMRAVCASVKARGITSLAGADWLVDLMSGQGADIRRLLADEMRLRHVVAVDQDRVALTELVRRRYELLMAKPRDAGRHKQGAMLHAVLLDLRAPTAADDLIATLAAAGAPTGPPIGGVSSPATDTLQLNAIICNFAVHYLMSDEISMQRFAALCARLIRVGGKVSLTSFDGATVFDKLRHSADASGQWDLRDSPTSGLKYSIRRQYGAGTQTLAVAGQAISVLLPFSEGEYYEEFLVNYDALGEAMGARGFTELSRTPFPDYIKLFEAESKDMTKRLTEADREYLSVYTEVVYERTYDELAAAAEKPPPRRRLRK